MKSYVRRFVAAMHARRRDEAALLQQSVRHRRFRPFHFDPRKDGVLISLKRFDMVGVGLRALRKGEKEFSNKRNILAVQSIIELVLILGIRNEMPCPAVRTTRSKSLMKMMC
jgi:hypothetical protein